MLDDVNLHTNTKYTVENQANQHIEKENPKLEDPASPTMVEQTSGLEHNCSAIPNSGGILRLVASKGR